MSRLLPMESETVTVVEPLETPVTVNECPEPAMVAMAALLETAVKVCFGPRFSVTDSEALDPA